MSIPSIGPGIPMRGEPWFDRMGRRIVISKEAFRMVTHARVRALAFLFGLVLVGCGSDGGPAAVVRGFVEAGKAGDSERAMSYIVESERIFSNVIVEKNPKLEYEIEGVRKDGEKRVVPVTIVEAGDRLDLEFVVVREGDAWRISIDETLERKRDALLEEMSKRREEIDGVVPTGD